MKSVSIFATTFLFIFGWKVTPIADLIVFLSIGLVLAVFIILNEPLPRQSFSVAVLLSIVVVYSFLAVIIGGATDTQVGLRFARSLVNFLGGAALATIYLRSFGHEKFLSTIIVHIYVALSAHALLIVSMYLSAPLRDSIYALANTRDYVNLVTPFLEGLRITGLTYGLAITSMLQMFGLLIAPSIYKMAQGKPFSIMMFWISVPVLIVSILLTGRSGLLLAILLIPLQWIVVRFRSSRARLRRHRINHYLPFVLVMSLIIGIAIGMKDSELAERFEYNITIALEVAEAIQSGGDTSTINTIQEMYFLPSDPSILMFGSGGLGRGNLGNVASDVGYIRLIFATGIIGLLILIMPIAFAVYATWNSRKCPFDIRLAICLIFLASVILNFKELVWMTRNQWSVQSLLVAAVFLYSSKHILPRKGLRDAKKSKSAEKTCI